MARRKKDSLDEAVNPYIALSDLMITVILIVTFLVALGQLNLAKLKYQNEMKQFAEKVQALPPVARPELQTGRNDPPGVQRWVFSGSDLFVPTPPRTNLNALLIPPQLTAQGANTLKEFAVLLKTNQSVWRRIRVEGHTQPPITDLQDDWELSAARAAVVARELQTRGKIPSYYLAVAGRAGQNHLYRVIAFVQGGDTASKIALQTLIGAGITSYSVRDVAHDLGASADFKARGLTQLPTLRVQDSNEQESTVDFQNTAALQSLARLWAKNDRVEILVEYSQSNK